MSSNLFLIIPALFFVLCYISFEGADRGMEGTVLVCHFDQSERRSLSALPERVNFLYLVSLHQPTFSLYKPRFPSDVLAKT